MSENKDGTAVPAPDKELDDLLESALEDMAPIAPSKDSVGGVIPAAAEQAADWNPEDNVWSEEFLQQAAATFESNMAALLSSLKGCPEDSISQDQIAATFQMMAEAAAQVMKPSGGENDGEPELETDAAEEEEKPKGYNDVSAAISQALESMNANAGNLQNQSPFSEDDLKNMFSGMNLNGQDEGSGNMFLPFMQGMMQSLLSKEVLYPSLKDIVDRYPNWLETNKSTLSNDDFTRYTKQNELMNKVCSELETEAENDSEDVKKARFDKVLDLMQKMQELGQPPEELSGELAGQGALPPQMGVPDVNQCRPM